MKPNKGKEIIVTQLFYCGGIILYLGRGEMPYNLFRIQNAIQESKAFFITYIE